MFTVKLVKLPLRFNIFRLTCYKYSGTERCGDWWIKEHNQNSSKEGTAAVTSLHSLHFLCVCARARARVCMCVSVRAYVSVCVGGGGGVCSNTENSAIVAFVKRLTLISHKCSNK